MTYDALKNGAKMALMCLESDAPLSAEAVREVVRTAYGQDDRRAVFHLEHLTAIGLAEKAAFPSGQLGYQLTRLGVQATDEVAIERRRIH